MSAEPSAKRRRAGALGLLATPPPPPPDTLLASGSDLGFAEDEVEASDKPDVFSFFAARASKHRELELEVQRLKEREAQLAGQLEAAALEAASLRDGIKAASARQQAREAQLELQLREQQEALQLEVQHSAGLAQQLRAAQATADATQQRAENLEQAAEAAASSHLAGSAATGNASIELQLQITQLQLELQQERAMREEEGRQREAALQTAQARYQAEATTSRLLQQQLEEAVVLAERCNSDKHAREAELADMKRQLVTAQTAAEEAHASGGDAVLVRTLRQQLRDAELLASEARRLKEQAANVHVLRGQLERAEARARAAEELLPEASELQGRLAEAEQQLARWRIILEGAAECNTPEDVLHLLQAQQQQQMEAAVQLGDKAEEVAQLRSQLEAADAARQEAETARQEANVAREAAAAALCRAERKLALLAREREGLKSILASYDEEYLSQHGSELGPQQARIVELEAQVGALHAHVKSLEEELGSRASAAAGASSSAAEALARAEAAEGRARALELEAQNLGKQVALLQERVGHGEYNPATTRVLHFKHNPEAEMAREVRDARLAELEAENEALKQHLQRLEAAVAQHQHQGTAEPASTSPVAPLGGGMRLAQLEGEANLLRRRVAELQKGSDRLQQVFNKQITLFREAVYTLFGYRVEMATDPAARDFKAQFALRPQHGDDGAQLVFRLLRDGRMVLVPTELSARLQREVETFVDRFRSIPAFTANLTMELFQKQTQC